jgi:hypothetical protein
LRETVGDDHFRVAGVQKSCATSSLKLGDWMRLGLPIRILRMAHGDNSEEV